jgi:hypothetical protein
VTIPLPFSWPGLMSAPRSKPRATCRFPRSVPRPACRPPNAHRYLPAKRVGYSASPVAPRAAKGPHKNQRRTLASQLASTAELPPKTQLSYTQLHTRKSVKPQFGSVTLRSPIIPLSSFLSLSFIAKMRLTYFLN